MDLQPIAQWVAPIVSTALTTYVVALINRSDKRREEEARNREQWREGVNQRLDEQDAKIDAMLKNQVSQTRSDLVHKYHRYVDDLGCAGIDEKQSWWAEYSDYCEICTTFGIKNEFIDQIAKQVMALPDRPKHKGG